MKDTTRQKVDRLLRDTLANLNVLLNAVADNPLDDLELDQELNEYLSLAHMNVEKAQSVLR